MRTRLERAATELGLQERVVFHGASRQVRPHYLAASLLVVSSNYESFGLVAVEALMCNLPVVSFRHCLGVATVVRDGVDGLLVDVPQGQEMSECLAKALGRVLAEPELLARLQEGAAGFNKAPYSGQAVYQIWDGLVSETH